MLLPSAPAFAGACVSLILAVTVIARRGRGVVEWSFGAGMVLLGAESACIGLTLRATTAADIAFWQMWAHALMALLPGTWLVFSAAYARGNAHMFLTRRRYTFAVIFFLAAILGLILRRGLVLSVNVETAVIALGWPGVLAHVSMLLGFIFALMDLERTYRASVGTSRWRIKYMMLGLAVLFVVRVYASSQALLYSALDLTIAGIEPPALLIAQVLIVRAMLRPGHFAADLYPSKSFLHGSITILLAGAYLFTVGVLAKLVDLVEGKSSFPIKAFVVLISLVILAVAAQSDHVRMRLRRLVSRHFHRPRVDYRTTWQQFTTHATSASSAPELSRMVVKLIADTFEVLSVTVWLLNERKNSLVIAASSSLSETATAELPRDPETIAATKRYFLGCPEPIVLESLNAPWVEALKRWHPNAFTTGGQRLAIPLIGRGELLGIITLGDRIGGEAFPVVDLDVFKCVGDHVAAGLLNTQLTEKLVQLKEVESFQIMAAFFVHDLKNAAHTLGLLLQNLPEHFHDPAFRADALRGCAKSVGHINGLIGRLTELREELHVEPALTDLNRLCELALAELPASASVKRTLALGPLPPIPLDATQFKKVLANLLLNAQEAITGTGSIHLATSGEGAHAIVSVTDNGCGMTPEFVRKSLFRPFQTTKQRGLGIGMFHSKMIVEAHGGRIDVESTPGNGTNFRIALPGLLPSP